MSKQLFEIGDGLNSNGNELECVSVGYSEPDGKKENFVYTFRLKSEIDAERKAAEEAEAEAEQQRKDERARLEAANAEGTPQS